MHAIRKINQHRERKDRTKQASDRSAGPGNEPKSPEADACRTKTHAREKQADRKLKAPDTLGRAPPAAYGAPSGPRAVYTASSGVSRTKREGANAERKNRHRTPLGGAPLGDRRWPRKPDAWRALGCWLACSAWEGERLLRHSDARRWDRGRTTGLPGLC